MNVAFVPAHNQGSNGDAGIEIVAEVDIHDRARVNAALGGLQFIDNFHRADFGSAGNGPGRKARHQSVPTVHVIAQLALQGGDQVHDMGVALDEHDVFYADSTVFRDTSEVVSAKIDQHDVLGPLLFVVAQLFSQSFILSIVLTARKRPGDGPVFDRAITHPHQHFRR